jgi:hypothetical protein
MKKQDVPTYESCYVPTITNKRSHPVTPQSIAIEIAMKNLDLI